VYDLLAPPSKELHNNGREALKIRSGANGNPTTACVCVCVCVWFALVGCFVLPTLGLVSPAQGDSTWTVWSSDTVTP